MTNTTARTPGPWKVEEPDELAGIPFIPIFAPLPNGGDTPVCDVAADMDEDGDMFIGEQCRANAAFIVRAANSHDELLAALDELLSIHDKGAALDAVAKAWAAARAALAKARQP